jgi:para-aminobenzoate synthetase
MHGRMSLIHCQDTEAEYKDVMYQCPSPFWAVRYHSLVVDKACECFISKKKRERETEPFP